MKPVTVKYYVAYADWSEGEEYIHDSPDRAECEQAIKDWDYSRGHPYHGFSIKEKRVTGYIVDEE